MDRKTRSVTGPIRNASARTSKTQGVGSPAPHLYITPASGGVESGTRVVEMEQVWRPIPGYEGYYSASNDGNIRRDLGGRGVLAGRILRQRLHESRNECFYFKINLCKKGKRKTHRVARLILSAFKGKPKRKMEARHLDGNTLTNSIDNLEWGTSTQNKADYYERKRREEAEE